MSQWVIDKTTLQVQSGHDLIQHVFVAADGFSVDHSAANGNGITFSRFCSADLADASAFYNAASGLGYNEGRLFLDGEESGVEGRPMAHIASGPDAGKSYELAALGNMAYENLLANPHTGDKTVVAVTDDGNCTTGKEVWFTGSAEISALLGSTMSHDDGTAAMVAAAVAAAGIAAAAVQVDGGSRDGRRRRGHGHGFRFLCRGRARTDQSSHGKG